MGKRSGSSSGHSGAKQQYGSWLALAALVCLTMLLAPAGAFAIGRPNDPSYGQQTASGGALSVMNEPQALSEIGSSNLSDVVVSALDTGVDLSHPDLSGRLVTFGSPQPVPGQWGGTAPAGAHGWNFLDSVAQGPNEFNDLFTHTGGDANPQDPPGGSGHGTAVTGVMAAGFNNGVGGVGVAPNARILAIRTCWDNDECPSFVIPDAMSFAVQQGARVVTMSWNMDPGDFAPAVNVIQSSPNTLFVALAGGNGGPDPLDPSTTPCAQSNLPNVICVSTSAPNDGLDCGGVSPSIVDFAVPTQNNVTTINGGGFGPTACATSFASPTAGGAAAMLFGLDPSASAQDVKSALDDSVRLSSAWSGKSKTGGVLDLGAAVRLFAQRRGRSLGGQPTLKMKLSPKRFKHKGKKHKGARLTLTLSQAADVTLTVSKLTTGRRKGRKCVAPNRKNRHHAHCKRSKKVMTLHLRGLHAGVNKKRFSGKGLAPGRYSLSGVAIAGGVPSQPASVRFTILR